MTTRHKVLIGLMITLFLPFSLFAQKPIRHYLKNDGRQVKRERDADFIRVYEKENRKDDWYTLTEYYPNKQVKRRGIVKNIQNSPRFYGIMTSYYPNGEKREEVNFFEGKKEGKATYYYSNGGLKKTVIHALPIDHPTLIVPDTLHQYLDSLGKVLVQGGNGFVREIDEDGDFEEGEYKDGLRHGEWTGTFQKQTVSFTEKYKQGHLISGLSRNAQGEEFKYTHLGVPPRFGRGTGNSIDDFRRVIANSYRLPDGVTRNGVSGEIIVSFVIDKNGETTDFLVVKDLNYGSGAELIRTIKRAKGWSPGYKRGVPVRVQYTLPLRINSSRADQAQINRAQGSVRNFD